MIFLSSPYEHPDRLVRAARFDETWQAVAGLVYAGEVVFSPVVHTQPLLRFGLPHDEDYWQAVNRKYLKHCDRLVILQLPGWDECPRVQADREAAIQLGKLVLFGVLVDADEPAAAIGNGR